MFTKSLILTTSLLAALAHGAAMPNPNANAGDPIVLEAFPDDPSATTGNITARSVDPAVRFTEYEGRGCGGWEAYYKTSDEGCFLLPTGDGLRIREIADTCRVFVYSSKNCDGAEFQAYPGNCYDVHAFYSIKTFCH